MLCASTNSPVARLIEKGISQIANRWTTLILPFRNAGKLEVYKLDEKNVSMLATISGAGPMTGFFRNSSRNGNGISRNGTKRFHKLKWACWQKGFILRGWLTVVGLIVGIIAYVGYNHLVSITDKVVHMMEVNAVDFLDLLNEPA